MANLQAADGTYTVTHAGQDPLIMVLAAGMACVGLRTGSSNVHRPLEIELRLSTTCV